MSDEFKQAKAAAKITFPPPERMTARIFLVSYESEKEAWREAAAAERVDLSTWMRETLNAEARRVRERANQG